MLKPNVKPRIHVNTDRDVFCVCIIISDPSFLTVVGALGDPCDAVVRLQDGLQMKKIEGIKVRTGKILAVLALVQYYAGLLYHGKQERFYDSSRQRSKRRNCCKQILS